ncbi:TetR/AcrR family transcriptional regulator [Novosphingobium sediminicola]|uniref:AcrR family transcriptional regulator n=1 Tax=Novosphingobium sediminicola TaxID=563162 RepID=A0A7W6CNJ9_9SPHN|nr:TetR/AcrR family transcriptional regulator [Novosphingobium sediminicola]MBB3957653.1 AcrR family transcriptional regulator [Novosphingobium sediminicola]
MSDPSPPPRTGAKKRAHGSAPKSAPKTAGASAKGLARREEILNGLMERLSGQELRNPSLREIGRALGIEPAHILYYFSSREELLQQVIMRWDEGARRAAPAAANPLDNFVQQVRRNIAMPGILHLYFTFAAEAVDPAHPAHHFFQQRFAAVSASLAGHIRAQQTAGLISAAMDPDSKARQLIALSDGLQLQSLVDPTVDAYREMMDAIATMCQAQ